MRNVYKYENLRTIRDIIQENNFLITFDLKSGYHHIPIAEEHHKYLGFEWDFGQEISHFVFVVLPFGLGPAGYVFSKLMRPLIKKWRKEGKRTSLYLDDGILAGENFLTTKKLTTDLLHDMSCVGLTINHEKSNLTPSQKASYLGFIIDTENALHRSRRKNQLN